MRLDSGDLAHLSIEARKLLDAAGFPDAKIVASNDLDEGLITALQEQGARIDVWGVGTKLATAYDQPALGGVYKLGAVRDAGGAWHETIKLSEQPIKISNPGVHQVRRLSRGGELVGDIIYDSEAGPSWSEPANAGERGATAPAQLYDLEDLSRPPSTPAFDRADDLLVRVMDHGEPIANAVGTLVDARARAVADLARLSPRTRRFLNPQPYPVGLDRRVHDRKQQLIAEARAKVAADLAPTEGAAR